MDLLPQFFNEGALAMDGLPHLLQLFQIFSNSSGIHPHITFSHPRDRTYVNLASVISRGNANDDVIFEAEPECGVRRLNASLGRVRVYNHPAHLAGSS